MLNNYFCAEIKRGRARRTAVLKDEFYEEEGWKYVQLFDLLQPTVRTANCLMPAEIYTMEQLISLTSKDILKIKHSGRKVLSEIKESLARIGLELDKPREFTRYMRTLPPMFFI